VRILVDQSGYELLNMGDVAMLQACVTRLKQQWPEAEIMVIAHESADLANYCPNAIAIEWTSEQSFVRLLRERYEPVWRSAVPYSSGRFGGGRIRVPLQPQTAQAVRAADLVVAAGGGYVTDTWRSHATGVLSVLSLAQRLGKPTAMFGQGIGPIRQRGLRMQARAVLPRLAVLGLREGSMGLDLAVSLGAPPRAVTVTGDDALELVTNAGAPEGNALGINVRVAGYAGVDPAVAAAVGDVTLKAAGTLRAPVVALPVSRYGADADLDAIRAMLDPEHPRTDVELRDLATPKDLIAAAARCRAIITGSYHTAVFGLAQGVPTVCVTNSSYYDAKFAGLRALYPRICFATALDRPDFAGHLRAAISRAWRHPGPARDTARDATMRLRDAGRAAYAQFRDVVEGTTATATATATAAADLGS
jgi:polysaccharide pyruvyl transferase WcaK-like protein